MAKVQRGQCVFIPKGYFKLLTLECEQEYLQNKWQRATKKEEERRSQLGLTNLVMFIFYSNQVVVVSYLG